MELDKRLGIVITTFILVLVGIVLLQSTADNVYEATTLSNANESITISSTDRTIAHEKIAIASGVGTTANSDLVNITFFGNDTINTSVADIDIGDEVNFTGMGAIVSALNFSDGNYNISYIYKNDAAGATTNNDLTAVSYFGNSSISTDVTGIEINDEINWTTNGSITVNSYNFSDGSYEVLYSYEGSDYVSNSTARTLLGLVTIFFAMGVLFIAYMVIKKGFEDLFK